MLCTLTYKQVYLFNQSCPLFSSSAVFIHFFVFLSLLQLFFAGFVCAAKLQRDVKNWIPQKNGFCTLELSNRPGTHKHDWPIRCIKLEDNWSHVSSLLSSVKLMIVEANAPVWIWRKQTNKKYIIEKSGLLSSLGKCAFDLCAFYL